MSFETAVFQHKKLLYAGECFLCNFISIQGAFEWKGLVAERLWIQAVMTRAQSRYVSQDIAGWHEFLFCSWPKKILS